MSQSHVSGKYCLTVSITTLSMFEVFSTKVVTVVSTTLSVVVAVVSVDVSFEAQVSIKHKKHF